MKTQQVELLGLKVPVLVYETIEEAIKAAGDSPEEKASFLNRVNAGLLSGPYTKGKSLVEETVAEITKVPYAKTIMDGKEVDDPKDTGEVYVKRALALNPTLTEKIQALVSERAKGYKNAQGVLVPALQVNAKAQPKGGAATLSKSHREWANAFVTGVKDFEGIKKKAAALGYKSFTAPVGKPKTDPAYIEALGWWLKGYQEECLK